ncbi:MAG: HindIII family type II restriction endonuclease, partial [Anoxybacillus sp.]
MTFEKLKERINYEAQNNDFVTASKNIIEYVNNIQDVSSLLREIGTIPESIDHDSTEEKLYAKASDAVLSKAFQQLGLKSKVLAERGDSADVIAESPIHGYTLVADAKAFRLSRTAKNQKDFKIVALSGWRKDSDYAVLCSPYFQYPSKTSQIYSQALEHNVCLFSWEHLLLMIENNIVETEKLNLGWLWNFSDTYANSDELVFSKRKDNFIGKFNQE